MYFKRSLQLFPSCCAALLDSRKSVAGRPVGLGHLSLFGWQGLVALGDWCGAVEGSEPGRCPGVERTGMGLVSYVFQNAKDDFKILMQP